MGVNVKIIKNANVVLENGIIWDGGILIEDGKIVKADFIGNIENSFLMGNYHNTAVITFMHLFKNLYKTIEAPKVDTCFRLIKN